MIEPFVDFAALDLVGVVVPSGTESDRAVIEADGSLPMTTTRVLGATVALTVALVLQVSVFPHFAWHGVVPNLVLLVVVGAALVRGAQFAMVLGFVAGVLLDLAPPADHVAGRWALALLAGRVRRRPGRPRRPASRDCRAGARRRSRASSFLGTSVFALSGLLLRDPAVGDARPAPGDRRRRASGTCC